MSSNDKAIVTCAITGVLTNPQQHPVPVTAEEMAAEEEAASKPSSTEPVQSSTALDRANTLRTVRCPNRHR